MSVNDFTLTREYLHELFEYKNGGLYRKVNKGTAKMGDIAGCINSSGYLVTHINGKLYSNHRLIFLMFYGVLPKFIDHIDNNRSNNKIENLRKASFSQNQHNRKINKSSTSGVKGITWHKASQKWYVQLKINGKTKSFGLYDDLELAEFVAIEARNKYHGKFARHS